MNRLHAHETTRNSIHFDDFIALIVNQTECAVVTVDMNVTITGIFGGINLIHATLPGIYVGCDKYALRPLNSGFLESIERVIHSKSTEILHNPSMGRFDVRIIPVLNKSDVATGAVCVVTTNANARKTSLSDAPKAGVFIVDRNYVMRDANEMVGEYLGTSQIDGRVCHKLFFDFPAPCPSCPVIEVFRTGKSCRGSCYDAKRQKFLALSAVPYFNPESGEIDGAIETFRDVSGLLEDAETARDHEQAVLMLDALPICCGLFNKQLEMVDCNRATVEFFQCTGKIETCKRIFEMFPERQPDGRISSDAALYELKKALESGYDRVEWTFLLPDGTLVPTEVTIVKISCGGEDMLATYTRDLREEKALRAAHDEVNERIRLMFDAVPLCCNLWDEQYNNIECNMEAVKLFDVSSKSEYLQRFFELSPEKQPDGEPSAEKALRYIKQAFANGYNRFEWMHQKLDGEPVPAEITLVRIKRGDHYIVAGYTRDLREEKSLYKAKEAAVQESQTDTLTRLLNKSATHAKINAALNGPEVGCKNAVICIDLDNFKSINDDFGHLFGDEVLIEIAKKIKHLFRSSDIVGRFGGDEFIVFVKHLPSLDFVRIKAESLCAGIRKTYRVGDVEHTVSASIGVAIYPEDGTSYDELYKKADSASYDVKRSGKNGYRFYSDNPGKKYRDSGSGKDR